MQTDSPIKETISYNPATGKVIGRTPLHTVEDLAEMIQTARYAQKDWAVLPVKKRVKYFKKVLQYLAANADELAAVISKDNGKTRVDALATEIVAVSVAVKYYCRKAGKFLKDRRLDRSHLIFINKKSRLRRVPYGVTGIISPWNYPFAIPFSEVIAGLMSGNAVILKTAAETLMAGRAVEECFKAAGLPNGLFQFVNLPGREAGPAFLENGIDKLFFTGSVPVGRLLMKKASDYLIPVNLELGGNDAMIVCEDANLKRAACGAVWAGFSNSGQSCGGVERIYVQESVYERFLEILKIEVEMMRLGNGENFDVDMGVMTTEKQLKSVQQHIDQALAAGAKIFAQSPLPEDCSEKNIMPAVVLVDVNHDMDVMRDETFGPVLAVMKFNTIDEAVSLANDSYLGLTGSVWSKNRRKAGKIASRILAGAVTINDHLVSHGMPETPWGGFKQSGIGRSHGEPGFIAMTQPQVIVDDLFGRLKGNFWWQPYDKKTYKGLKGILTLLYGKGLFKRISGMIDLIKVLPRMFR